MTQIPEKEKIEGQLIDHNIQIGKDILELVTSAMYTSPLTIYREYIQNSSDAIELAEEQKILKNINDGRIDVNINVNEIPLLYFFSNAIYKKENSMAIIIINPRYPKLTNIAV